jgi:signal transduction histidine kinase/ActR/RegA family two-component response regulator
LSLAVALLVFVLPAAVVLYTGRRDYADMHIMLDTGMYLLPGVLALLFWDMSIRIESPFPKWLAISFGITAVLAFVHALVGVEWPIAFAIISQAGNILRPTTWPPPAHLLPVGIGCAVWQMRRRWRSAWPLAALLATLTPFLYLLFSSLPLYTSPTLLGVTRPALMMGPALWAIVGLMCWRWRSTERLLSPLAMMAAVLFSANVFMLYSRSPHDSLAIVAHLGLVGGYLILLLSVMQLASTDMRERLRAERELAQLNEELEGRVLSRTEELNTTNQSLAAEVTERKQAETKIRAQLVRLDLLQQITRSIGERQDLRSIFQVVIRRLEDDLPIDFGCLCLYDAFSKSLTVASVGVRSQELAMLMAMPEQSPIPIDENGLGRCVQGQLVYESDIAASEFPFPQRLANANLRSLVIAPLLVESRTFGVLVAARREANGFSSGECEFLRQLSEHVALAAHQGQLYSSLQQAYDDLRNTQQVVMQQERLRAVGQMASGIAHDINNALAPMSLYVESLLENDPSLSERSRASLKIVERSIDDVAATVARLREFYRQREPQLTLAPVDLNAMAQQVAELTRARWRDMAQQQGAGIELVADLVPDLPLVMGAENEIREALTNLIFNAVDAMPNGGTLTVRTRIGANTLQFATASTTGRYVHIEVTDTGIGMDEKTQRRCLEPFFTTKGERGTGLGLAMVYGMAERHSANVEIESAVGRGTTVRLTFSATTTANVESKPGTSSPPVVESQRILLIDDDPLVLKSLSDALEADGHVVVAANGGQEGIETFRAAISAGEPPSIVITDLGMPYVDGRQVASAIKHASPATPIILLTGWGQRLVTEGEVPPHVDLVLNKPPKLRDLREALAKLCGKAV